MGRVGASVLPTLVAVVLFTLAGLDMTVGGLDYNSLIGIGLAFYALGRIVP